jgi:hypothetical protein
MQHNLKIDYRVPGAMVKCPGSTGKSPGIDLQDFQKMTQL